MRGEEDGVPWYEATSQVSSISKPLGGSVSVHPPRMSDGLIWQAASKLYFPDVVGDKDALRYGQNNYRHDGETRYRRSAGEVLSTDGPIDGQMAAYLV